MKIKEFTSIVSKTTGKLFSPKDYGRIGAMLKRYTDDEINMALDELKKHPTPYLIENPLNFIQRHVSINHNKKETKELLENLFD